MPEQIGPEVESETVARVTNLLAAGWGVAAPYLLVRSVFVSHQILYGLAAPIPLFIVWATLERKRWGRLALLSISATAVALFVGVAFLAFGLNVGVFTGHQSSPGALVAWFKSFYAEDGTTLLIVIGLAVATGFWMCRAAVVEEFERNKRTALAVGQWAIAVSLAVAYTVTLFLSLRR